MDPINVLKLFVKLERDLAVFYGKLKSISMLREFVETFEIMENQCSQHSKTILEDYKNFHIPDLNVESLIVLHNNVKEKLLDEIKHESNMIYVMKKLAESEEQVGKIYKGIAVHYRKNAEKYKALAEAIDEIGNEEFRHRDHILAEVEKRHKQDTKQNTKEKEAFSEKEYKKFVDGLYALKKKLDRLDLTNVDLQMIDREFEIIDTKLAANRENVLENVGKFEQVLKYQRSNDDVKELIEKIKQVRL